MADRSSYQAKLRADRAHAAAVGILVARQVAAALQPAFPAALLDARMVAVAARLLVEAVDAELEREPGLGEVLDGR